MTPMFSPSAPIRRISGGADPLVDAGSGVARRRRVVWSAGYGLGILLIVARIKNRSMAPVCCQTIVQIVRISEDAVPGRRRRSPGRFPPDRGCRAHRALHRPAASSMSWWTRAASRADWEQPWRAACRSGLGTGSRRSCRGDSRDLLLHGIEDARGARPGDAAGRRPRRPSRHRPSRAGAGRAAPRPAGAGTGAVDRRPATPRRGRRPSRWPARAPAADAAGGGPLGRLSARLAQKRRMRAQASASTASAAA